MEISNWSKVLVSQLDSLESVIRVIEDSGLRIAIVVDDENKVLGTITDGDIRRALLNHKNMKTHANKIMNKNPILISEAESLESTKLIMEKKGVLHLPVVDENRFITGLRALHNSEKKYDNPVFLMAGGFGKRLHPLTKDIPKPLLKVGERPILETILMQFIEAGFWRFYISTHFKAEIIQEHFGDGSLWNVEINYVHESIPLGTAGALGLLPNINQKLPIIMMNGDLLTSIDFKNLLDFHNQSHNIATMCVREYDIQVPFGVVNISDENILSIEEKPTHTFFVNAGIYVMNPAFFESVTGDKFIDIPDLFNSEISRNHKIGAYPVHENWIDIGRIDEYEKANREISK